MPKSKRWYVGTYHGLVRAIRFHLPNCDKATGLKILAFVRIIRLVHSHIEHTGPDPLTINRYLVWVPP